jgi:hypothetical protein
MGRFLFTFPHPSSNGTNDGSILPGTVIVDWLLSKVTAEM